MTRINKSHKKIRNKEIEARNKIFLLLVSIRDIRIFV